MQNVVDTLLQLLFADDLNAALMDAFLDERRKGVHILLHFRVLC